MDKIKFASKIFAIVVLVALMVAAILQLQEFATKPKDKYLQGQMEARRVLVAGKVPGRIEKLLVREGQTVKKNALVAVINSPEIEAKKMQAQGALGAAKAQANKAKNGARSEDVKALKAMVEMAKSKPPVKTGSVPEASLKSHRYIAQGVLYRAMFSSARSFSAML